MREENLRGITCLAQRSEQEIWTEADMTVSASFGPPPRIEEKSCISNKPRITQLLNPKDVLRYYLVTLLSLLTPLLPHFPKD
jgi:hypothetical protein